MALMPDFPSNDLTTSKLQDCLMFRALSMATEKGSLLRIIGEEHAELPNPVESDQFLPHASSLVWLKGNFMGNHASTS